MSLAATLPERALARKGCLTPESLTCFQQGGDMRWIAIAQTMLGASLLAQGDATGASRRLLAGLAGHQAAGDQA